MNHTSVINLYGTEAVDYKTTLKAADLDWEVRKDAVHGASSAVIMPRKKLLYRSDNDQPLGIVGEDYCPSDPRVFVQTQFEVAERMKGQVTRIGFIEDRSRAFSFIKIADINLPKSKRKVGDVCGAYIYSTDGWDGGTPRKSRLYVERLRCLNGMTSRELKARFWISHTKDMAARYDKRWQVFAAEIQSNLKLVTEEFTRLATTPMNQEQMDEFLVQLIPGGSTASSNRRERISGLFTRGTGTQGQSRWDAYNAVTEYATHYRRYRTTDATSVETNRFLGVLEANTLAQQALVLLN